MSEAQQFDAFDRRDFQLFLAEEGHADASVVDKAGTRELVYDIPTDHDDLTVRLFSTLDKRDGDTARDAGNDAIRCLVWDHAQDKPIASTSRTNRIQTWRDNLAPKIDEMLAKAATIGSERERERNALLAALDELPAPGVEDEVEVVDVVDTEYGKKFALDSPYEAKDAIKAIDWDTAHPSWNGDAKHWEIDADADAIQHARDTLADHGWTLTARDDPSEPDHSGLLAHVDEGDDIVVHYQGKNNGNDLTKTGRVVALGEGRDYDSRWGADDDTPAVMFRRHDDGHHMIVIGDELFTSGSAHPFVGTVTDVVVDDADADDDA